MRLVGAEHFSECCGQSPPRVCSSLVEGSGDTIGTHHGSGLMDAVFLPFDTEATDSTTGPTALWLTVVGGERWPSISLNDAAATK